MDDTGGKEGVMPTGSAGDAQEIISIVRPTPGLTSTPD
jgi:hypothetical protein